MSQPAPNPQAAPLPSKDEDKVHNEVVDDEPLPTDGPEDIHEKLQILRRNEVVWLGKNGTNARTANAAEQYFYRVALDTTRYIRFVIDTWWSLLLTTFFGGLNPFDWFSMFFYAFGGTTLLFFVLIFCSIINSPLLVKFFIKWSTARTGGLGLVNNANPNLFHAMTSEQVLAGKEVLGRDIRESKDTESYRQFNLDIARFLLQLSAIVYEHPNEAIRKAVSIAAKNIQKIPPINDKDLIDASPTAVETVSGEGIPPAKPHELEAIDLDLAATATAVGLGELGGDAAEVLGSRLGPGVGLGLGLGVDATTNGAEAKLNGTTGTSTSTGTDAGTSTSETNSAPPASTLTSELSNGVLHRLSALDPHAAAALTRAAHLAHAGLDLNLGASASAKAKAGDLVERFLGTAAKDEITEALRSDGFIRKFTDRIGIEFEPLSELNDTSSAFSGLFWDPKSNWIVVAFKGTQPIEFSEWLSDFNAKMAHCGTHVQGFKKVHKGFKERVYPEAVSPQGNVRPYDTISLGIKTLAKHLRLSNKFPAEKTINVWFTGHSLGCATATLVYSRFLMRHEDMGKKSVLRDSYLFAAPIVCDRDTVEVFNHKMMEDKTRPKTMWRITSNNDIVATGLPEFGDYTSMTVSPNNAFAFAHLGTEIQLKDFPENCKVAGNHIFYGTRIDVVSKFSPVEIQMQHAAKSLDLKEKEREKLATLLQKIPIVGRVIAHGTVFYWDQLNRVALGKCNWVRN